MEPNCVSIARSTNFGDAMRIRRMPRSVNMLSKATTRGFLVGSLLAAFGTIYPPLLGAVVTSLNSIFLIGFACNLNQQPTHRLDDASRIQRSRGDALDHISGFCVTIHGQHDVYLRGSRSLPETPIYEPGRVQDITPEPCDSVVKRLV